MEFQNSTKTHHYSQLPEKLITTGSVPDTQKIYRPSKSIDPEVAQVVQKVFAGSPKKVGSLFTVHKMCSKMSLNGVLGSRTTVKHSLPKTATFAWSLERRCWLGMKIGLISLIIQCSLE